MPPAIYTQNVIALIWDFDKTLTHGYMQDPLFAEFDVDPNTFWDENNALAEHYRAAGCRVSKDTVYLNHILSYVSNGVFKDLTNDKLRDLGAAIALAPGIPDFFDRTRQLVASNDVYQRHDISVEHYVVSTGLRAMIEGSGLFKHVDGIWACDLLPEAAPPGYREQLPHPSHRGRRPGRLHDRQHQQDACDFRDQQGGQRSGRRRPPRGQLPHPGGRPPRPDPQHRLHRRWTQRRP
jgi:hypothetical protein